jgi:hypothetical protein
MDDDLRSLSREQLINEVQRLRAGIRKHRDASGQELCWHHPALWGLLPEQTAPEIAVPAWPQFIRGCVRYRQSLDEQAPQAPRTNQDYPDPARPRHGCHGFQPHRFCSALSGLPHAGDPAVP